MKYLISQPEIIGSEMYLYFIDFNFFFFGGQCVLSFRPFWMTSVDFILHQFLKKIGTNWSGPDIEALLL